VTDRTGPSEGTAASTTPTVGSTDKPYKPTGAWPPTLTRSRSFSKSHAHKPNSFSLVPISDRTNLIPKPSLSLFELTPFCRSFFRSVSPALTVGAMAGPSAPATNLFPPCVSPESIRSIEFRLRLGFRVLPRIALRIGGCYQTYPTAPGCLLCPGRVPDPRR
jgi:hypothetical protein